MDDMTTPVFHVGFPKSGSTFLQSHVFPLLDKYEFMGLRVAEEKDKDLHALLKRFYNNLFKTDGMNFDLARSKGDLDRLSGLMTSGKTLLLSHEGGASALFAYPDAVAKAERLYEVFGGDLKIIIIIREQTGILASQYRDHPFDPRDIQRGKPVSLEKWYRLTDELRYFRFTDLIHYDRLVRVYDKIFGKENVLVLPVELMKHDPVLYSHKMGNFLGVSHEEIEKKLGKKHVNVGKSVGENRLRKLRRRVPIPVEFSRILPAPVYKTITSLIKSGAREKVEIPEVLAEEIRQRYAASNAWMEKRCTVTLRKLGYSVT